MPLSIFRCIKDNPNAKQRHTNCYLSSPAEEAVDNGYPFGYSFNTTIDKRFHKH